MTEEHRVLIVDDNEDTLHTLEMALLDGGLQARTANTGEEGIRMLQEEPFDLVYLDYMLPGMNGLQALEKIVGLFPYLPVIIFTASEQVEVAVKAMKMGAADYLRKPLNLQELVIAGEKAIESRAIQRENARLREELSGKFQFGNLIGNSQAMQRVLRLLPKAAESEANVLILGENGSGKEVIARAIHHNGPRRAGPFIAVNCAAIPGTLFESEMFGHEKGAFTGAHRQRKGQFELADGGTLFLDEIGEIDPMHQVKLLRAIQEHTVRRVGGEEDIPVDVRFIAATNRDLEEDIENGRFRQDLYYRLNVINIRVPPLRERVEDIPKLVDHFLRRYQQEAESAVTQLDKDAWRKLRSYDWPGNVRELENVIEAALVYCDGSCIRADDLSLPEVAKGMEDLDAPAPTLRPGVSLSEMVSNFERAVVRLALEETNGVQARAAELLGISPRSMWYLVKKHNLTLPTSG